MHLRGAIAAMGEEKILTNINPRASFNKWLLSV